MRVRGIMAYPWQYAPLTVGQTDPIRNMGVESRHIGTYQLAGSWYAHLVNDLSSTSVGLTTPNGADQSLEI